MISKKTLNVGVCDFCQKLKVNKTYCIYRIFIMMNNGNHTIGILNIYEELSDYLMGKGIHLSASQVILMRPDITLDFLKIKYNNNNEQILNYHLEEAEICFDCYESVKKEVPEK